MKIIRTVGLVVGVTAALAGPAVPAFAASATTTPTTTTATTTPATVDSLKAAVDTKAEHITAKLTALQTKLATKPKLAAAKTVLQADITKALADTAAWRKLADAATTKAGVRAADPAHATVKADLVKLHADLATAKGTAKPAA